MDGAAAPAPRPVPVARPQVDPPRLPRPSAPPVDELRVLYTEQGHTLAQIGRMFHTSAPVARELLTGALHGDVGIVVVDDGLGVERPRPVVLGGAVVVVVTWSSSE